MTTNEILNIVFSAINSLGIMKYFEAAVVVAIIAAAISQFVKSARS